MGIGESSVKGNFYKGESLKGGMFKRENLALLEWCLLDF
jgi:hypothetical protein